MKPVYNIVVPFSKGTITNLEEFEWNGVQELVKEPRSIMVYEHEEQTKALIALGAYLHNNCLGIMRTHIFHFCQNYPVLINDFDDNFVDESCPVCGGVIYEESAGYNLELIIKYSIKLTD